MWYSNRQIYSGSETSSFDQIEYSLFHFATKGGQANITSLRCFDDLHGTIYWLKIKMVTLIWFPMEKRLMQFSNIYTVLTIFWFVAEVIHIEKFTLHKFKIWLWGILVAMIPKLWTKYKTFCTLESSLTSLSIHFTTYLVTLSDFYHCSLNVYILLILAPIT